MKSLIFIVALAIGLLVFPPKDKEINTLIFEQETIISYKVKITVYAKYGYSVKALVPLIYRVHTDGTWNSQNGQAIPQKYLLILQK